MTSWNLLLQFPFTSVFLLSTLRMVRYHFFPALKYHRNLSYACYFSYGFWDMNKERKETEIYLWDQFFWTDFYPSLFYSPFPSIRSSLFLSSFYLSVYFNFYLSQSIHTSITLFISPLFSSIYLYHSFSLSFHLSIYLFQFLSIYFSIIICFYLNFSLFSFLFLITYLSLSFSLPLFIDVYQFLPITVCFNLSFSLFLSSFPLCFKLPIYYRFSLFSSLSIKISKEAFFFPSLCLKDQQLIWSENRNWWEKERNLSFL